MYPGFQCAILGHLFALIPLLTILLLMRFFKELLGYGSLLIIIDQSFFFGWNVSRAGYLFGEFLLRLVSGPQYP